MSHSGANNQASEPTPAQIEAQLEASRLELARDVDALAARFSPKEQASQALHQARARLEDTLSPLLDQVEDGLGAASRTLREAQEGDPQAQRRLGAFVTATTAVLAALAIGARLSRR